LLRAEFVATGVSPNVDGIRSINGLDAPDEWERAGEAAPPFGAWEGWREGEEEE